MQKEGPRKKRNKKHKDPNAPKRPQSAYFLWLNEHREQIKKENPGISLTDLTKKAGEMWRELKDKTVSFLSGEHKCANKKNMLVVTFVQVSFKTTLLKA